MLQTTPARVARPIAPAAADEAIPDEDLGWEPLDLPRAVRSRRTFRIPVILIAAATAVGAYLGGAALLRLPLAHAEDARAIFAAVLGETLEDLESLSDAAGEIVALRDELAAATDGSYKKAWDDTLGKSGTPAPELDASKLNNCA